MALAEVLVAATILAAALAFFLVIIRGGAEGMETARNRAINLSVAESLLRQANRDWPRVAETGTEPNTHARWTRRCVADEEPQPGARLVLVRCTAKVWTERLLSAPSAVTLATAAAIPVTRLYPD